MASNSFGKLFRITTWGESHGKALGVVIDGCPAGLRLSEEDINKELVFRRPGRLPYSSPRKEEDRAEILSGIFEGKTTGAPISIIIFNRDVDSGKYEPIKNLLRPGHANFTYLEKYNIFDYRGGGRASARETVCRVAAGAVAKKILRHYKITIIAYIKEIGAVVAETPKFNAQLKKEILNSPIFCPNKKAESQMMVALERVKKEKDSLGGVVETLVVSLPAGLGDPVYEKLGANLASAMMSIPAARGFEIGSGFQSARMRGSESNDIFKTDKDGRVWTETNFAGGIVGGISSGMPLCFRTAFKPTSSIEKEQQTLALNKKKALFKLPAGSRHDICLAIRAVPVVESMTAMVLVDALLMNRSTT